MAEAGAPSRGGAKAITSLANPSIKEIRGLALAKNRKESGLFVAEGLKLVADALEAGWEIRRLVHAAAVAGQPMVRRAVEAALQAGAEVLSVSEAVLAKLARRDNPQTVIGVFRQRLAPAAAVKPGRSGVWVALEGIRDPGNLGTILRTVDAVGADGAILVGDTVDPFGIEAVRATMGSIFHVPIARMRREEFLAWRAGWPGAVIGTHLAATADYRIAYPGPTLLLMGTEQSGLTEALAVACTRLVRIPMEGKADSLNLAIATGLMLYEIRRDRLPAGSPVTTP